MDGVARGGLGCNLRKRVFLVSLARFSFTLLCPQPKVSWHAPVIPNALRHLHLIFTVPHISHSSPANADPSFQIHTPSAKLHLSRLFIPSPFSLVTPIRHFFHSSDIILLDRYVNLLSWPLPLCCNSAFKNLTPLTPCLPFTQHAHSAFEPCSSVTWVTQVKLIKRWWCLSLGSYYVIVFKSLYVFSRG